jgi:hypothetical protein
MVAKTDILKSKKLRLVLLLAIALATMMLLSGGLAGFELLPGRDISLTTLWLSFIAQSPGFVPYLPIPVDLVRLVVACLWVLLIISVIGLIVSPEFRRETFRRIIRYTLFFLIVYGLIQVFQKALPLAEEVAQEAGGSALPEEITTEPFPAPPDFVVNPPSWFVTGVSIALIALVLVSIWFTWRRLARIKLTAETPLELLAQEAELALQGLQAGSDLKDTIMRCYFEMSRILKKERGLQRQQAMTPREFERYLAESGFASEHIQRLTRLFEGVRYGSKSPGRREEQEAVACLTAIVQSYGRP